MLEQSGYQPRLNPANNPTMPAGWQHTNLFAHDGASDAVEADAMARLVPRFLELGVECQLVQRLANWSARFWPSHDWNVECS